MNMSHRHNTNDDDDNDDYDNDDNNDNINSIYKVRHLSRYLFRGAEGYIREEKKLIEI